MMEDDLEVDGAAAGPSQPRQKPQRAYKACNNCRIRKARCNLGDVNDPSEPPCARCRRGRLECSFAPSKKRGRKHKESTQDGDEQSSTGLFDYVPESSAEGGLDEGGVPQDAAAVAEEHDPPLDSQAFAVSSLRNPVEALGLLVRAADAGEGDGGRGPAAEPVANLQQFCLVKSGATSELQLQELCDYYFRHLHPILPLVPHERIPRTPTQLAKFASKDAFLLSTIALIASKLAGLSEVHARIWQQVQTLLLSVMLGEPASVGTVEGLLLLSEYLPRDTQTPARELNSKEEQMSWMNVGLAIRLGYALGLDQKMAVPLPSNPLATTLAEEHEQASRERIAWTYCFSFDRTISTRTGRNFWSRGPGLSAQYLNPNSALNYPSLRRIDGVQEDFAGYLHAHVDLSACTSQAHDILFPSKARTLEMIKLEAYARHLDDFATTLKSFRSKWEAKSAAWETYPMKECLWISFHYLRLYIFAFGFQAHLQRAEEHSAATGERELFPAGLAGSPDSRWTFEALDAAGDLLRLTIDRLHPGGALHALPMRYYQYLSYAGVFLMKAAFISPMSTLERTATVRLLKRLISCLASSTDLQHPAVRYARLLDILLKSLNQDSATGSRVPTRAPSPVEFSLPSAAAPASAPFDLAFDALDGPSAVMQPFDVAQPFHQLAAHLGNQPDIDDVFFSLPAELPAMSDDPWLQLLEQDPLEFWQNINSFAPSSNQTFPAF